MANFAICIFLSAFLLFQIQPIISKIFLPWFGGAPAVWSSAMLFFQILLTGGYVYSHWLATRRKPKQQVIIHLVVLCISLCLLITLWLVWPSPIMPGANWKNLAITNPLPSIFVLLFISVGLPFFILSTNSPLMQAWFSRGYPGRSPYWLYALSNIGSLLGLIAYPLLVEPALTLQWQGWAWAGGYLLFVAIASFTALRSLQRKHLPATEMSPEPLVDEKPSNRTQLMWIVLSACASLLFLAVTNQVTQDVAAIPFLWVLPLAIYLLSFILTFSNRRWYHRGVFTILLLLGTGGFFFILFKPLTHFIIQIILYSIFLFAAAMICHGELYALRPTAAYLTRFYLMVSIGGALGGMIVNFAAPFLFRGYWEFYLGLVFIWILLAILSFPRTRAKFWPGVLIGGMATIVTIVMVFMIYTSASGNLFVRRNFYGVIYVKHTEVQETDLKANQLVYGATVHGFQLVEPGRRNTPTSYYTEDSGVGLAILNNPNYGSNLRVGVLGLGVGTLAAYGQPGDVYRFYEINPVIIDLANGQDGFFSFLEDSQADVEIVLGDARLSLESEIAAGQENAFDILVLDTFSSDSIPAHLVTQEALAIYLQSITPDGLIAAHISNRYLDLKPVFWQLAQIYNLHMVVIGDAAENNPAAIPSTWVLLTLNASLLETPELAERADFMDGYQTDIRLWTDDYSNLFQILK